MNNKILINALDTEECRIARIKEKKLEEFHIESAFRESIQGNIYKAVITRVEPGLQSVFVDFGGERHGFLQKSEIHSDYFQDNDSGDTSLKSLVKKGQELIVQVTKDPIMNKGAMLTTYISLPGRYMVLMPGSRNHGISRKIEDDKERARIKEMLTSLKIPEGFGVIVRTAGSDCNKLMLKRDLNYLLRLWNTINQKGISEPTPNLLYKERNLVLRWIRDYFTPDISAIWVDHPDVFHEVRDFIQVVSPAHKKCLKLYKGQTPIFAKYEIEDQIASIFESRVELKGGGSIVIEQTEAMVTIDVNSGKASHNKSVEETAFLTNMKAAEEVARQLRLRDLGGLITIDFIDMMNAKHKSEVEKCLKQYLKEDKARIKLGKISQFGLLEMSRQRIRPPIEFGSFVPCTHCRGKGTILSTETLAIGFLRKLRMETLGTEIFSAKGTVPSEVADYLLNKKRKELIDLEMRRDITIRIEGSNAMIPGQSEIVCETRQKTEVKKSTDDDLVKFCIEK